MSGCLPGCGFVGPSLVSVCGMGSRQSVRQRRSRVSAEKGDWREDLSRVTTAAFGVRQNGVDSNGVGSNGTDRKASGAPSNSVAHEEGKDPKQVDPEQLEEQRRNVRRILQLFWKLAKPYWKEEKGARWRLAGVVALTLVQSGISVAFSYIGRDFWTALSQRDMDKFTQEAELFFAALLIGTPVVVLYSYARDTLGLRWREWLTRRTLEEYLRDRSYYNIENSSSVDNPDQRISEDLRAFTQTSLQFMLTLVISGVDLVAFSSILYSIYPPLFVVLFVYSSFGTAMTTVLGKSLVSLNFAQLQNEADLRYALVRFRENAESVAFYRGEEREKSTIETRLGGAVDNFGRLLKSQRNLEFFTTGYRFLIQVLPALVVAPLYFKGAIELGVVSQSFSAFNHILNDLSLVVSRFEALSQFSAGVDRLGEFAEFLERQAALEGKAKRGEIEAIDLQTTREAVVEVQGLTLLTPDGSGRTLLEDLSFRVNSGERLLIVGRSGAGKSSLLRAVAGLWSSGTGTITRTNDEDVLFLPQKPYCTLGDLREQLTYPSQPGEVEVDDGELLEILEKLDLASLPARFGGFDAVRDWSDVLSLGEQQRLAFGRLLFRKPKLAILDEASSALDLASEARLYRFLADTGTTVLSVGHRPSLLRYHDQKLRLGGDGVAAVERVNSEDVAALVDVTV